MTIETDGSITPEDSLAFAARILQDQLNIFVNFEEPRREIEAPRCRNCRSTRRC